MPGKIFMHHQPSIFNVHGNHYRLITRIDYRREKLYVVEVLAHAEYDRRYT